MAGTDLCANVLWGHRVRGQSGELRASRLYQRRIALRLREGRLLLQSLQLWPYLHPGGVQYSIGAWGNVGIACFVCWRWRYLQHVQFGAT